MQIEFTINTSVYTVTESDAGYFWSLWDKDGVVTEGDYRPTAAEAQQSAMRHARKPEEYREQDEDDYHRAQQRLNRRVVA